MEPFVDTYKTDLVIQNAGVLFDGQDTISWNYGIDFADQIIEFVLTFDLAVNAEAEKLRTLAGLSAIGGDATALAAAQAALVVPAPVDPSAIAHNDLATRNADDAHPHEAIAFTVDAATTLGTVTGKVEVFNAAGVSLGFVPVYDAIT